MRGFDSCRIGLNRLVWPGNFCGVPEIERGFLRGAPFLPHLPSKREETPNLE
jgi:hypothetical protein